MTTSVTLADIATRIDMLEIRCGRCDRAGQRRVSRLVEQHGGSMRLPDLRTKLAQGCDHAGGHNGGDRAVWPTVSCRSCVSPD